MTKRITKADRAEIDRRAAVLRHGVRRDALRPIDAADWPEVRGKLETDLAALLRPELRSAGIERLYVLSSSEAGIVDPPSWAGIFSTDIADVFRGQLADRWRGPGAAFLLNDSILKVGRALVVAIAAHEVGHAAEYLTRGIDVAVAQPESRRLARATAFGLDQPAAIGMPFLSQHSRSGAESWFTWPNGWRDSDGRLPDKRCSATRNSVSSTSTATRWRANSGGSTPPACPRSSQPARMPE